MRQREEAQAGQQNRAVAALFGRRWYPVPTDLGRAVRVGVQEMLKREELQRDTLQALEHVNGHEHLEPS